MKNLAATNQDREATRGAGGNKAVRPAAAGGKMFYLLVMVVLLAAFALAGCDTGGITPTPVTPTSTAMSTPRPVTQTQTPVTPTSTPTSTPRPATQTSTPTATNKPAPTQTPTMAAYTPTPQPPKSSPTQSSSGSKPTVPVPAPPAPPATATVQPRLTLTPATTPTVTRSVTVIATTTVTTTVTTTITPTLPPTVGPGNSAGVGFTIFGTVVGQGGQCSGNPPALGTVKSIEATEFSLEDGVLWANFGDYLGSVSPSFDQYDIFSGVLRADGSFHLAHVDLDNNTTSLDGKFLNTGRIMGALNMNSGDCQVTLAPLSFRTDDDPTKEVTNFDWHQAFGIK